MSESKFESIGEDMMVEVFVIVGKNLKTILRLRCVSKLWRRLVNSWCLHRLTYNDPLELKGHLMKMEFGSLIKPIQCPPVLGYTAHRCCQGGDDDHHHNHFGQDEGLLERIKSPEEGDNMGFVFLDACNGLLLHRLNNNNDNSSSPPVYRVSNLETNSCVMVNGEPDTGDSMLNKTDHAVLAYNPAESLMSFKIVAFFCRPFAGYKGLCHKCMRIYSSKTGKWSPDLNFDHVIEFSITTHRWMQQSLYLNGAVYRLLLVRYLLRFETTDEEGERRPRAQAIEFPEGIYRHHQKIHVGINKGQLNFARAAPLAVPEDLRIWVLQEEFHGNKYSYQWIVKHSIRQSEVPGLELRVTASVACPVGFHPSEDAIVLITADHFQYRFSCYNYHTKLLLSSSVSTSYDYAVRSCTNPQDVGLRPYTFPLFSCAVPLSIYQTT